MTQKELLYFDDGINHEKNIIAYLNYAKDNVSNNDIISFFEKEIKKHEKLHDLMLSELEESSNE